LLNPGSGQRPAHLLASVQSTNGVGTVKKLAAIALLAACLTSGCSALDRVNDALYETGAFDVEPSAARSVARDGGVTVLAGSRRGRGAIVGPRTVLTVFHVVGDETTVEVGASSLSWARARVVDRIPSSPEPLVVLEVEISAGFLGFEGFAAERTFEKAPGGHAAWVLASTGTHAWARGIRPGDSGSPVIDARGGLVGLLVGATADGRGVHAPLPPVRGAAEEIVVARLSTQR
jgi:S1-C subfamily serine protease